MRLTPLLFALLLALPAGAAEPAAQARKSATPATTNKPAPAAADRGGVMATPRRLPWSARALVALAAPLVPVDQREAWRQEWLAELAAHLETLGRGRNQPRTALRRSPSPAERRAAREASKAKAK